MDRVNLRKIAEIANVDHSTVSRALAGSPRVKQATKDRILKIAREFHYVPNDIARSLKTRQTRVIGLVVSDIRNPFFTEIVGATESCLAANNYSVILCNTNYSIENERNFLRILRSKSVDGIIMSPASLEHLHGEFFERFKIPHVMLDIKHPELHANCVYVDQELGAYSAVEYLVRKGHRRIAFMAGPASLSSSEQAITGFRAAHRDADIPLDESLVLRVPQDYDAAYVETVKLLKSPRKITAIFSLTDFMCIGIYRAMQEAKLRIPEDIAVVGYDDLILTRFLQPSLTTVRQPNSEIGTRAAEIVLANIREGAKWKPQTVRLKPELIIRQSA